MKRFSILTIAYLLSIILTLGAVSFQPSMGQTETTPLASSLPHPVLLRQSCLNIWHAGLIWRTPNHADVIILELNTPGGGIELMSKIVQQIRTSEIPIIVYVSPQNAMAGSAGTLITLAGHLSAMAPESNHWGSQSGGLPGRRYRCYAGKQDQGSAACTGTCHRCQPIPRSHCPG